MHQMHVRQRFILKQAPVNVPMHRQQRERAQEKSGEHPPLAHRARSRSWKVSISKLMRLGWFLQSCCKRPSLPSSKSLFVRPWAGSANTEHQQDYELRQKKALAWQTNGLKPPARL